MSYKLFPNLTTNYTMRTRRDLTDDALINLSFKNMRLGQENNYNENIRISYDPKLFKFLTGSMSYSGGYSDTYDRSTETRNSNVNRSITLSGTLKHQMLFGKDSRRRSSTPRITRGRRAEAESDEVKEPKGDPFYKPVLKGLKFLTGWLSPFTYRLGENFNQSVPGILFKPGWKYRFAFDTKDDLPRGTTTRNPSASKSNSYDFGSGFTLLGGLSTTVKYRKSTTTDLVRVGGDLNESRSISWPDLTLTIRPFKTLPFIKKYVNWFIGIFSPRTGFSRQLKENENLKNGWLVNESEIISRSPLISINFKLMRSLSLSGSYSKSTSTDIRYGFDDGVEDSRTIGNKQTLAFSTRYSFSAPGGIGIPLFGKIKFKSTVSFDLNVKYNSNVNRTSEENGPFVIGAQSSDFSISPVISYVFSKQIKGGLTGRWQDNNDIKFNRKSHVREIQMWTEIRF